MSALPQITLSPVLHREQQWILVKAPLLESLHKVLLQLPLRKYTKTYKAWLVPLTKENYKITYYSLSAIAQLDTLAMKKWFADAAKITITEKKLTISKAKPIIEKTAALPIQKKKIVPLAIHKVNAHVLPAMQQMLQLKSYSISTQRTYLNEMAQFLKTIVQEPADKFTTQRLKDYLQYCYSKLKLTENTIHSRMNAMKFYYEQVLFKEKLFWEIPRPKKPLLLPKLLNEEELRKLFNALVNKKHKAMLFTAYSAGLRVSEVVNLKLNDIDSKRMQIFISRAKGKKDRYVNLSPMLLDILRNYISIYKPKPTEYLFESEQTLIAYPIRTVQQIFMNAKLKAGIKKEVGMHSLRHSFATHLLDKGTDIRYIKEILGHFDIRTTERYLHVSKKQLINIVSPLDDLMRKENIDW